MAQRLGTHHLEHLGLTQALATMIDQVSASSGIKVEQRLEPIGDLVRGDASVSLYRVAQEALNNVIKHAQANQVAIHLVEESGCVRMTIEDDGVG